MDKHTACELAYKNGYNEGYNKALEDMKNLVKENAYVLFRPLSTVDTIITEFNDIANKLIEYSKKE